MRDRETPLDLLSRIPLFRGCTKDELRHIDRAATQADYSAGQLMCREGDVGRELIMIVAGEATIDRGGVEIAKVGAGAFIGEMSLLDGGPRSATVTSTSAVKALVLPTREFWQVIDEVPAIAHRLLATLAERLRAADEAAF
ncbi:MAG TPA: cyclic nucleotide-binding domain-containing protein [Mycobacteriales bacterium]|jgi:CRP-like cAMP-binding protein|nr:cyclic nucleotide-binding domain-containing protein [Mycobacteriales bacterium]